MLRSLVVLVLVVVDTVGLLHLLFGDWFSMACVCVVCCLTFGCGLRFVLCYCCVVGV